MHSIADVPLNPGLLFVPASISLSPFMSSVSRVMRVTKVRDRESVQKTEDTAQELPSVKHRNEWHGMEISGKGSSVRMP